MPGQSKAPAPGIFLCPLNFQVTVPALKQRVRLVRLIRGQEALAQLVARYGLAVGGRPFDQQADGELHHGMYHHQHQHNVRDKPPRALFEERGVFGIHCGYFNTKETKGAKNPKGRSFRVLPPFVSFMIRDSDLEKDMRCIRDSNIVTG